MLKSIFGPFSDDFIKRHRGQIRTYTRQTSIYVQGDPADELFYVLSGKVLVTIGATDGKEALIAVLGSEQFFGEDCVDAAKTRNSAVTTATDCEVAVFRSSDVLGTLKDDPDFVRRFTVFLMERNKQLKESLVDQMILSSEKRLARLLLKLAASGGEQDSDLVDVPVNQETLARMVGASRPRISEFMNKFRKLGHIEYNGALKVHRSLASVLTD